MRPSLTYANVMATIAVFIALGGVSYAAMKLPKNSVGTKQLKKNAVTMAKIKDGAVSGSKVDLASLGTVPSATNATNASIAANANALGGIPASSYTQKDCKSLTGQIKGFARVIASSTFSSTFTTNGVEAPYNCSGGTVEARRIAAGYYEVRFNNSPEVLAMASTLAGAIEAVRATATIGVRSEAPGLFEVRIGDWSAEADEDYPFLILTP